MYAEFNNGLIGEGKELSLRHNTPGETGDGSNVRSATPRFLKFIIARFPVNDRK